MGREARCVCRWGPRSGYVTALLESHELIIRGEFRARAALNTLERVGVCDGDLEFTVAGESVALSLGADTARRWAAAIAAPPPGLARKLGITSATRLHVTGTVDDDALRAAIADAAEVVATLAVADLAIVRTDEEAELARWAEAVASGVHRPPVWIVYIKGREAPLGESRVRACLRHFRYVDTKVAAVSARLTALRFNAAR